MKVVGYVSFSNNTLDALNAPEITVRMNDPPMYRFTMSFFLESKGCTTA